MPERMVIDPVAMKACDRAYRVAHFVHDRWAVGDRAYEARRGADVARHTAYWNWTADRGVLPHDAFAPGWSRLYPMSRCAPHDYAAGQR